MKYKKETGGTCYEDAYGLVCDVHKRKIDDLILVHGTVYSVPWGKRIGHAWTETGDIVLDSTMNFAGHKERYYEMGNAKVDNKFTAIEAMKLGLLTRNFGPWKEEDIEKIKKQKRV